MGTGKARISLAETTASSRDADLVIAQVAVQGQERDLVEEELEVLQVVDLAIDRAAEPGIVLVVAELEHAPVVTLELVIGPEVVAEL